MSCLANQWEQPILKYLLQRSALILNLNAFSALLISTPRMSGASGKWFGFNTDRGSKGHPIYFRLFNVKIFIKVNITTI